MSPTPPIKQSGLFRFKSFRTAVVFVIICVSCLPAFVLSIFPAIQNANLIRENTSRELKIKSDALANFASQDLDGLTTQLRSTASDSDIERAARIPIFITKADFLLKALLVKHSYIKGLFFFDMDGRLITAVPNELEFSLKSEELKEKFQQCQKSLPSPMEQNSANSHFVLSASVAHPIKNKIAGLLCLMGSWELYTQYLALKLGAPAVLKTLLLADQPVWESATEVQPVKNQTLISSKSKVNIQALSANKDLQIEIVEAIQGWPNKFYVSLLLIFLMVFVFILIIGWLSNKLAGILLSPFDRLYEFVDHYAQGKYQIPPPQLPFQEFQKTIRTLENMGWQIQKYLENVKRMNELERMTNQAEMENLKSQLRPHLIFNSLNSILATIKMNPETAADMILKLSDMYRLILVSSKGPFHRLQEEVHIVRLYLELEQERFKDRLNFQIHHEEVDLTTPIPPLLIQTLVENCVRHGIGPSLSGGEVLISIKVISNERIQIQVSNTGQLLARDFRFGIGLNNTLRRLDLAYDKNHNFKIFSEGQLTVADFYIQREPRIL